MNLNCYPCSPCSPDMTDETGAQCSPCNPCSPDQLGVGGSQCYPCHPCSPDKRRDDGSQCYPCHPCSPDQTSTLGGQCYPCNPCSPAEGSAPNSTTPGGSSGCFITSACVESMGLDDDCGELQTLRALRDKRRLYDRDFDALVKEYYIIAPKIVCSIDSQQNRKDIYEEIYKHMVIPCVNLIKQNQEDEAVVLYEETVMSLKRKYLPA